MRILLMDTIKPIGIDGSSIHRWEVAKNLSNMGCDVYAISYTNVNPEGVIIAYSPKNSKIRYILQTIKLIVRNHFDIVYTRNVAKGIIGLFVKKIRKFKLVVEVNSISPDEWKLIDNQLKSRGKRFRRLKRIFFKNLEIIVFKKADAVIVVTQGIKDYLIDCGVNINKIWIIENGANTDLFYPVKESNILNKIKSELHLIDNEKIVQFVGNLAPWQGVEYLVYAVPLIINECPKTKILIVGDGILKDKLELLSNELNMEHYILFTGTISYENIPEYMNISDVCVAPFVRTRNETMGLSPLKIYEYLACGKPVVASNIKGVGDLLENSNSGITVIPEDSVMLANAIIKLLKDKQLREQMGNNGRKLVVNNYSWEITAKKTTEVFSDITEKV